MGVGHLESLGPGVSRVEDAVNVLLGSKEKQAQNILECTVSVFPLSIVG